MCWKPVYVLLMLGTAFVDYCCAIRIADAKNEVQRRLFLGVSLCANLGLLFFFKYFGFFSQTAADIAALMGRPEMIPVLHLVLPVGISFYTFQELGYTIDVYCRRVMPERHMGIFMAYVSFFPQLVAGPIERAGHLLPQIKSKITFDAQRASSAFRLILLGLFKKVVIADRLAEYVNTVYASPHDFGGAALLCATIFFGIQIYCDFGGYTDIARGSARLLGINLMENFRAPYFARSISEFWKRWHISLSTWFRDYVYLPLGGNRHGGRRWAFAIMAVFTISGLWHGAAITFVIWGAFHGVAYLCERGWARYFSGKVFVCVPESIRSVFAWALTMAAVFVLWIFFRATDLADALFVIRSISIEPFKGDAIVVGFPKFVQCILFSAAALLIDMRIFREGFALHLKVQPLCLRWSVYYAVVYAILFLGAFNQNAFIYFQF
jgi:D-alanyl-lipoteichoic acid acyltransferase DltB (MBOAT superfamily)